MQKACLLISELNIRSPFIKKRYKLLGRDYHFVKPGIQTQKFISKYLCLFCPISELNLKAIADLYIMNEYDYDLSIQIILTDNMLIRWRFCEARLMEHKRIFYMNRPSKFTPSVWKIAIFDEIASLFRISTSFSICYYNTSKQYLDCILQKNGTHTYELPELTDETYKRVRFDLAVITKKLSDKGYHKQ